MPTTSRIDFGHASNEGPNGDMQSSPTFSAHGRGQIERATRLNAIDAAVHAEACRRTGLSLGACRIDYFGSQIGATATARVVVNGRSVAMIPLRHGEIVAD